MKQNVISLHTRWEWGTQILGKIMIFKCHYKLPFWSYIHVVNMFLVAFDQLNTLRNFSEPFKAQKTIFSNGKVAQMMVFGGIENYRGTEWF